MDSETTELPVLITVRVLGIPAGSAVSIAINPKLFDDARIFPFSDSLMTREIGPYAPALGKVTLEKVNTLSGSDLWLLERVISWIVWNPRSISIYVPADYILKEQSKILL